MILSPSLREREARGDRTYKLCSDTTSEYGRYVKSLGEPRDGLTNANLLAQGAPRKSILPMGTPPCLKSAYAIVAWKKKFGMAKPLK